jgi:hypothetical protein
MLEINLSTCSKADRKKVIKLAKSVGYKWRDTDRFKDREWEILELTCKRMTYYYGAETTPINLPQDWDKVYDYLGINPQCPIVELNKKTRKKLIKWGYDYPCFNVKNT